jgi:hypothetical protein
VVVEEAQHDRLEPFPRLRDRIVHALTELLLYLFQLSCHTLGDRFALEFELPIPGFPADMRETQKTERLGLTFSSLLPVKFGKPPELDPARLIRMKLQSKLLQPLREVFPETVRICLVLEAQYDVVRVADDNHYA